MQALNLPSLLLSAPEPDDPKKTSDAEEQKEHPQEEKVSREESLQKIGKSRKRSKDEGVYTHIFGVGSLGGLGGPKD